MEKPVGVTLTVPDEAFSLKDLLTRAVDVSGVSKRVPSFDPAAQFDSADLEKIDAMDFHEREVFTEQLRESITAATLIVESDRKRRQEEAKAKAKEDEELRSEFRSRKAKGPEDPSPWRQGEGDAQGKQPGTA